MTRIFVSTIDTNGVNCILLHLRFKMVFPKVSMSAGRYAGYLMNIFTNQAQVYETKMLTVVTGETLSSFKDRLVSATACGAAMPTHRNPFDFNVFSN